MHRGEPLGIGRPFRRDTRPPPGLTEPRCDVEHAGATMDPSQAAGGIPAAAVQSIERMFAEAERGGDPDDLKQELDRWGAFPYYEERFLNLFRRRRG